MERIIVNEYVDKQGIYDHTDMVEPFGPLVMSLSLGSAGVMDFTGPQGQVHSFWLPPRSIVILSGPARYEWKHGIKRRLAQEGQTFQGQYLSQKRDPSWRRVSITWRSGK